jgi:hypothetical protein
MEGIKFDKKLGILDLVLSGKKTMFRLPAKTRSGKVYKTKYQVGQNLAIMQPYKDLNISSDTLIPEINAIGLVDYIPIQAHKGWTNVTAVKPEMMEHIIEIVSVKTEVITDITDEDCFKEGIVPVSCDDLSILDGNMPFDGYSLDGKTWLGDTPSEAFALVSNKTIKKDIWKENKNVDVYEFKLIK